MVGCSFQSSPSDTMFRCETAPFDCPTGFSCVAGECIAGGGGADGQVDGPVTDGAPVDGSISDAQVTDALGVDICQEAISAPNSDGCSAASVDVTAAALAGGATVYGDSTSYINDLGSPTSQTPACLGYITAGVDAFYRVDALAGDMIRAKVYGATWDTVLYLTSGCTTGVTCFTAADNLTGTNEEITYNVLTNGTFYVVVDSTSAGGCYALDVSIERP